MYVSDILSSASQGTYEERGLTVPRGQDLAVVRSQGVASYTADGYVDRRAATSGKLGSRRTDRWLPYSAPFVAQLLAQMEDQKS
jgi:hypothetical protein